MATAAVKIPIGLARGKTITDCTVAELEAACTDVEARLCAKPQGPMATRKHKVFVAAARAVLGLRRFPVGSYETTETANRALRDAAEAGHLLSPQPQMAVLLPGCALLITAFRVDLREDVFPDDEVEGQLVPNKALLDRVARDLGISWRASARTDSGRDPYVRSYRAECVMRNFDATKRGLQGNAGIDLNQDSPLVRRLRERNLRGDRRGRGQFDVERKRESIDSLCDTRARLKACRQLGLRSSYTATELAKPFFMATLQFTAKTDDPELKQLMGQHVIDSFKASSDALYGKRGAGQR